MSSTIFLCYVGSVLDFSSLRQRDSDEQQQQQQQQQEILAANTLNKGCNPVPIKTISGTLTPLPPLLQLTECEGIPLRGYNFSARKPSQDSGECCDLFGRGSFPTHKNIFMTFTIYTFRTHMSNRGNTLTLVSIREFRQIAKLP